MTADLFRRMASRLHRRRPETGVMRRARETFELHDLGVAMYRQRMRTQNPEAADAEIDDMVWEWLKQPRRPSRLRPPESKNGHDSDSR